MVSRAILSPKSTERPVEDMKKVYNEKFKIWFPCEHINIAIFVCHRQIREKEKNPFPVLFSQIATRFEQQGLKILMNRGYSGSANAA